LQEVKDKKNRAIKRYEERVAKAKNAQLELAEKEAKKERIRALDKGKTPAFIVILKVKFDSKPSNSTINSSSSSDKMRSDMGVKLKNSRTRVINLPTRF
jgi:hypothetical protein